MRPRHPHALVSVLAVTALCLSLMTPITAAAIPTISRAKIISIAKSGVGCRYVWGGTCWNPSNKTWKGADCSGYVTVTWQIPKASKTTDCLPHYYTTSTFQNSTTHWTKISRSSMLQGDALVYNSGSAGHVVLYNSGDKWGSAQVYEARGSAYGIVYRTKSVSSTYAARRRNSLGASVPTYPLLTITSAIKTISGQARDFCQAGKSKAIFDWKSGQTTEVHIDVKNSGTAVAKNVYVGLWGEEPYLKVSSWNIYSNWKKGSSFALNDTDALQKIAHANPGKTFKLWLGAMSIGETKRVVLKVKALKFSVGAADHPDVRAWVSHVDSYYEKKGFSSTFNNVGTYQKQNGGDLRTYTQTDVLSAEICDKKDNDCDGKVDEGVCTKPTPAADSGPGKTPAPDSGPTRQDSDSGAVRSDSGISGQGYDDAGGTNLDRLEISGSCAVGGRGGSLALTLLPLLLLALVRRRR